MHWQREWGEQARAVNEAAALLKHGKVGSHTAATLSAADRAAGRLQSQLNSWQPGGGGR